MKRFWYRFLVCVLSLGMLYPTWMATGAQKARAGTDTDAPYLTSVGFTSSVGAGPSTALPGSLASGYYLKTDGNPATDYLVQFAGATSANEPLQSTYAGLYLTDSSVSPDILKQYYDNRVGLPNDFKNYLKSAVDGANPFAYILGNVSADVNLIDSAKRDLGHGDTDMTIPGDYPNGSYSLSTKAGEGYLDLAGNEGTANFSLVVDNIKPVVDIISPLDSSSVNSGAIIEFTNNDPNSPECSIDNINWVACESGVTTLGDLTGFSALSEGAFSLYLDDQDMAGNTGTDVAPLIKDTIIPENPTNLGFSQTGGVVDLSWDSSISGDVEGYNVYRSSSPFVKINSALIAVNSFSDSPGFGMFMYKVTSVDMAGNESEILTTGEVVVEIGSSPLSLIVSASDGEVSLSWDAVGGVDHYDIYHKKSSDSNWTGPTPVLLNSTKIQSLVNGIKYDFKVVAVGSNGVGGSESVVSATPKSSVVLASVPTVQDAVVVQPETPVATPEVTPPTEETGPEIGQIKGEETATSEEEDINWTPWIILFVLIVLAGAATGGYFYWFGNEEEEIVSEQIIEKSRKSNGKKATAKKATAKKDKRW